MGTVVGMLGKTRIEVSVAAGIEIGEVGGNTFVMLKPNIGCRDLKLELETDGKAKLDGFVALVPSVGANIIFPVSLKLIPDVLLFSDLPFVEQAREPDNSPRKVQSGNDHFLFTPSWAAVEYVILPKRIEGDDAGLWIGAKLLAKFHTTGMADYNRDAEEKKLANSVTEGQAPISCPGEPSFALTIDDLELSTNGLVNLLEKLGLPLPMPPIPGVPPIPGMPGSTTVPVTVPDVILPGRIVPAPDPASDFFRRLF